VISLALRGVTDVNVLHSWIEPEHSAVAAAPVIGSNGQVLGAVYVRDYLPALGLPEIIDAAGTLAQFVIGVAALSTFSGLLYAVIVTRHLSKRLRLLSGASMAFAQGDLSRRAAEDAPDEIGELGRQFNRMADTLTQQRTQLADEARSNATAAERSRLARELHDSVKQHVFAASLKLGAAQGLWAQDSDKALALASGAAHAIEQAKQELAVIIPALSPPELEHGGLVRALQTYARNWSIETGIAISTQLATNVPPMSHQHEQVFFRVAQEALNNVARHSGATQAQLALHCHNSQVVLSIGDNGHGFDAGDGRHREGFGLRSMRERAEALGGHLQVHSTPAGTHIVLSKGAYS
jgi:signal transduction histidine kinase